MRRTREQWRGVLEAYEESGMSQAEFARAQRLNVGTFRYQLYATRSRERAAVRADGRFVECVAPSRTPVPEALGSVVRIGVGGCVEIEFASVPPTDWLCSLARELSA